MSLTDDYKGIPICRFSMMSHRAGAGSVHACELSDSMASMSRAVLSANQMPDTVSVIHALSTNLCVPRDLPRR